MTFSNFNFIVSVHDDGKIDVDWSGSFTETMDSATYETVEDSATHGEILDAALGYTTDDTGALVVPRVPDALRNLADHIEKQRGN